MAQPRSQETDNPCSRRRKGLAPCAPSIALGFVSKSLGRGCRGLRIPGTSGPVPACKSESRLLFPRFRTTPMNSSLTYQAGRRGPRVRGDCWFGFEPNSCANLDLQFSSKLEALYGEQTRDLIKSWFEGHKGRLEVEDQGAYPFVLRARAESVLRKATQAPEFGLVPEETGSILPEIPRDALRRSRLYLPGNEAKYMLNAALHHPDGVILDLEDSVAPGAKEDARSVVRHALHSLNWGECERMVRINQGDLGLQDVRALAGVPMHLFLLPKIETADQVRAVEGELEKSWGAAADHITFMPILESALGVMNALEIARASSRNVALTLGLEDLTADLGVAKTPAGHETLWARSQVIYAAKATGLQAIDSVYGDVGDEVGLRASLQEAKSLGFQGKGCVHPRQIRIVHEELAPSEQDIQRACKVALAFEEARSRGEAVVSLGSKMIDPPVVKRALQTVEQAESAGLLDPAWRQQNEEA